MLKAIEVKQNSEQEKKLSSQPYNYFTKWYEFSKSWYEFSSKYFSAMTNAFGKSLELLSTDEKNQIFSAKTQNQIRKSFDESLRSNLKKEDFASSIGPYLDSSLSLLEYFGINRYYQNFMDYFAAWNTLLEPIRDNLNRTPSEIIKMHSGFQLLHYKPIVKKRHATPILVVYSLINRHYILDLFPKASVIRNFLDQGFDVYATDWATPDSSIKNMTLEDHIQYCVDTSVNKVLEISGEKKVSLFGYCWGGIFALVYAALHPENVKNLVLHATPVDLEKTDTVVENFTKHVDVDKLVDTIGNVPGSLINFAFILRNPLEAVLKYWTFFSKPRSTEEISQFFAIETWLYDSRPIIGEIYRDIINNIYKKNLLIKNQLKVGPQTINLNNLTMPVLNIVGLEDDLVPPDSSRYIMCEIPSKDKALIEFQTGHVGLCISPNAHEKLWPEVGEWLGKRS